MLSQNEPERRSTPSFDDWAVGCRAARAALMLGSYSSADVNIDRLFGLPSRCVSVEVIDERITNAMRYGAHRHETVRLICE